MSQPLTPYRRLQHECRSAGLSYRGATPVLKKRLAEARGEHVAVLSSNDARSRSHATATATATCTGAAGMATPYTDAAPGPSKRTVHVVCVAMFLIMMSITIRFPFTQVPYRSTVSQYRIAVPYRSTVSQYRIAAPLVVSTELDWSWNTQECAAQVSASVRAVHVACVLESSTGVLSVPVLSAGRLVCVCECCRHGGTP